MKNIFLFMTISCLLCCCNNVVAQKDANAAREKAVALNKEAFELYATSGRDIRKYPPIVKLYRESIDIDSTLISSYICLAERLAEMDSCRQALQAVDECMHANPSKVTPDMFFMKGLLTAKCGFWKEGRALLNKAAEMKVSEVDAKEKATTMDYVNAAYINAFSGNKGKSLSLIEKGIEMCGQNDRRAEYVRARCLDFKDWFANFDMKQEIMDYWGGDKPMKYDRHVKNVVKKYEGDKTNVHVWK